MKTPTESMSAIDPHRTRLSAPLVVIGSAALAIASAGFYAGSALTKTAARMERLEALTAQALTRSDIDELKRWMPRRVSEILASLRVSCPAYVVRGRVAVECRAIPTGADEP